jgi:hypothetical protein
MFDVVASTCLLSQLISAVVSTVGERHPQFLEAIQGVRLGHLRLLADLIVPGGKGLLITDIVSSDTFPVLGTVPHEALPGVLVQLLRVQNFFHGLSPSVMMSVLRNDPFLASRVEALEGIPPWRWDLGVRVYAVLGLTWKRK